jgi:hypothetical protein
MIQVVSRTPVFRALALALFVGILLCGRFALAGAASLQEMLDGTLTPSSAPALLGPITSAGRIGWQCKPERAASSKDARDSELPASSSTP